MKIEPTRRGEAAADFVAGVAQSDQLEEALTFVATELTGAERDPALSAIAKQRAEMDDLAGCQRALDGISHPYFQSIALAAGPARRRGLDVGWMPKNRSQPH